MKKNMNPGCKSSVTENTTRVFQRKLSCKNIIYAGTAVIIVKGKDNYTGTATTTFKITKAEQSVKSVSPTRKTIAAGKSFQIKAKATKEQGTAQFKQVSQKAKVTIASNGKVTVKKGTKRTSAKMAKNPLICS